MKIDDKNLKDAALGFHPAYYILGILLVIMIRGDGYFPFPKSWPQEKIMFVGPLKK